MKNAQFVGKGEIKHNYIAVQAVKSTVISSRTAGPN